MEEGQKSRRPRIGDKHSDTNGESGSAKFEKADYGRSSAGENNKGQRNNTYTNNNRPYNQNRNNNYRNTDHDGNKFTVEGEKSGNTDYNIEREYNRKPFQPRSYGGGSSYGGPRPYNNDRSNNSYGQRDNSRSYNNDRSNNGNYESGDQQRQYQPNRYRTNAPYQDRDNSRPQQDGAYQRNNAQRYPQRPIENRPQKRRYNTPEPILYKAPFEANESIRLNKYLSTAGVCSRREADEYIVKGNVKVNGSVITELGTKILFGDVVLLNDKVITPEHKVYVVLNKPKDCVTTTSDPQNRLTVMDIIRKACPERIFPVGRLDRNTTGVLLLTNDGELASKLTHPQYIKKKIYHVVTDRDVTEEDMQRIADGVELSDGPIHADAVSYANDTDKDQIGIEIHSGRNRIIRRMFEALGYKVRKLDRVYFAGLTKKDLSRGRWRYLTREEVSMLHMGAFE